jgi:nucleoside-diphosphate-sugar epimerase
MAKDLILISGVNGYIAAVTAKYFLDHGHSVRGTVRKASSAQAMIDGPLKSYAESGKFTIAEVPDITVDGAFDEAVKGVTAIAHLASPVSMTFSDPKPILHAAINGTKTILESAYKFAGPQLKSVVVMSSIASTRPATEPPYKITEKDWNDFAEQLCEEHGTNTPGPVIYAASKAAGERAFWKFQDDKKPSWSMASVNPVYVPLSSTFPSL